MADDNESKKAKAKPIMVRLIVNPEIWPIEVVEVDGLRIGRAGASVTEDYAQALLRHSENDRPALIRA